MKKQVKTFIVSLLYLLAVAFGTQAQTTSQKQETANIPRSGGVLAVSPFYSDKVNKYPVNTDLAEIILSLNLNML